MEKLEDLVTLNTVWATQYGPHSMGRSTFKNYYEWGEKDMAAQIMNL